MNPVLAMFGDHLGINLREILGVASGDFPKRFPLVVDFQLGK
jgi:hypothetical protein